MKSISGDFRRLVECQRYRDGEMPGWMAGIAVKVRRILRLMERRQEKRFKVASDHGRAWMAERRNVKTNQGLQFKASLEIAELQHCLAEYAHRGKASA